MLLYRVSSNCSLSRRNESVHQFDKQYAFQESVLMMCILPISFTASLMNGVAFYIFLYQTFDKPNVKFNLLCVALSEISLQFSVGLEAAVVLSGLEHLHQPIPQQLAALVHIYINVALCIRNWNVVMLAVARCEAILLPFTSRSRLLLSTRVLSIAEVFIHIIAVSLSTVRNMEMRGLLCTNLDNFFSAEVFLDSYEAFQSFDIYAMFLFQSFLPVSIIMVCTIIMWISLRKQYHATSTLFVLFKGLRCRHASFTNRKRTSYLAFFMSLGFCLFEIPTFINTCIAHVFSHVVFYIHPDLIGNALVIVNSLVNFIIYSASSALFRKAFLKFWLGSCHWCQTVRNMEREARPEDHQHQHPDHTPPQRERHRHQQQQQAFRSSPHRLRLGIDSVSAQPLLLGVVPPVGMESSEVSGNSVTPVSGASATVTAGVSGGAQHLLDIPAQRQFSRRKNRSCSSASSGGSSRSSRKSVSIRSRLNSDSEEEGRGVDMAGFLLMANGDFMKKLAENKRSASTKASHSGLKTKRL